MQTSQRARDLDRLYQSRRGHAPKISISDTNHHVTEAIGDMYGAFEDPADHHRNAHQLRPLSFVSGPFGETIETNGASQTGSLSRSPLTRLPSNDSTSSPLSPERRFAMHHPTSPPSQSPRSPSGGSSHGSPTAGGIRSPPPPLHRSPSETATQQFPLNDIDYESSPAAVAQELSNLQAIRRMSMDVGGIGGMDPDLPTFNSTMAVPTMAPTHTADEEDPSRLFWVPARLHPELAPKEFKTFIQDRVKTIKRSSLSSVSSESSITLDSGVGGSLRRKKSMLSRQVNDGKGYQDGAERLERKKSLSGADMLEGPTVHLQDLEALVDDPAGLMRSMSINSARRSFEASPQTENLSSEDMPILGPKPPGQALKRSTRTTYRRGSLKKGERTAPSRRLAMKQGEGGDLDEFRATDSSTMETDVPNLPTLPDMHSFGLSRVNSAPLPQTVENFSRPGRRMQTPSPPDSLLADETRTARPDPSPTRLEHNAQSSINTGQLPVRSASTGRTTANHGQPMPVPTIIETPPPEPQRNNPPLPPSIQPPERTSSIDQPQQLTTQPVQQPPNHRPVQRPPISRPGSLQHHRQQQQQQQPQQSHQQTLEDMTTQPSSIHSNNTRTDNLSIIPTFAEEEKPEKKGKDKKEESRKTSWGWFSSGGDGKKEEKKSKSILKKASSNDRTAHDTARLDVLQASIDGKQGRESIVIDRSSIQIDDEPATPGKKLNRKVSGEKKEKDGLFSSLFGGGKKKGDKESHKKGALANRGLSPDPPQRILKPDIDYNWSRFSILEERAIYRMAHIKLANPRRELYSQVLLSNFMYSYLAKVQQMHPQLQVPQSAAQKREMERKREAEAQDRKQQQEQQMHRQRTEKGREAHDYGKDGSEGHSEEFAQYQRYQEAGLSDDHYDGSNDTNGAGQIGGYGKQGQFPQYQDHQSYKGQNQQLPQSQPYTNFSAPRQSNGRSASPITQNQQSGIGKGANGLNYSTQYEQQQPQQQNANNPQQHQQPSQYHASGIAAPGMGLGGAGLHGNNTTSSTDSSNATNNTSASSPTASSPNYLGSLGFSGKPGGKPLFTFEDSDDDDDDDEEDQGVRQGALGAVRSQPSGNRDVAGRGGGGGYKTGAVGGGGWGGSETGGGGNTTSGGGGRGGRLW